MQLEHFDAAAFLRDHWQKKPLLIRNPWKSWINPVEPDELAGLACEEEVEARLIRRTRASWKVEHGPFLESRFARLGKKEWTLLVQAVDHHVPEVAALLEPFRFIPNWRVDDVMVSYATDGGGVGPHFDQYDVFLVQGSGRRRWQTGAVCGPATPLLPHDDLRLLAYFEATDEWILEPGDILYVPPRFAHNGIAVGDDCMTYSIGFRAPLRSELIAHWCDHLLGDLQNDDRYDDPDLQIQHNPGEISPQALARLHAMVSEKMLDGRAFAQWFGHYNSTPKYADMDWQPEEAIQIDELRALAADDVALRRNPASRFSFIRQGTHAIWFFVDGNCFECRDETAMFAERLCTQEPLNVNAALSKSDAAMDMITKLLNQGSLALGEV
ncbi:MAG: cupin domain-containing protein [Sphingobium sp.]|uniref:cupin domain-containing protein n=1 Tax=Sphingobium sp. TaxID=1912891 RepID=UPI0029BB97C7|nr:cupin domain-containing protein [Sphingobium sp.]MDX3909845.1 cupin domain-containing protein [Sphingobium sp.]